MRACQVRLPMAQICGASWRRSIDKFSQLAQISGSSQEWDHAIPWSGDQSGQYCGFVRPRARVACLLSPLRTPRQSSPYHLLRFRLVLNGPINAGVTFLRRSHIFRPATSRSILNSRRCLRRQ